MHAATIKYKEGMSAETKNSNTKEGEKRGVRWVLDILCVILLVSQALIYGWLTSSGGGMERAPDKDNKDRHLHTHCCFIAVD